MHTVALIAAIALFVLVISIYRIIKHRPRPTAAVPVSVPRFFLSIGLFVVIYVLMVAATLVLLTLVGVNFTLVSSFLSAPLWIIYVIIARAWARPLAAILAPHRQ